MLAIRLPEDIETRLKALAAETGRTKTALAREAIVEYLDDLEDYYLAEARAPEPQDYSDRRSGGDAWAMKSSSTRMLARTRRGSTYRYSKGWSGVPSNPSPTFFSFRRR